MIIVIMIQNVKPYNSKRTSPDTSFIPFHPCFLKVIGIFFSRDHTWTDYYWLRYNLPLPFLRKPPPPHNFRVAKGMSHIMVSRDLVNFTINDKRAHDLLNWVRWVHEPDEIYFNTLHYSPDVGVPGAYQGQ
jgi:hypothetical protein